MKAVRKKWLSVYDGRKILMKPSDVSTVTRRTMHEVAVKSRAKQAEETIVESVVGKENDKLATTEKDEKK